MHRCWGLRSRVARGDRSEVLVLIVGGIGAVGKFRP